MAAVELMEKGSDLFARMCAVFLLLSPVSIQTHATHATLRALRENRLDSILAFCM